MAGDGFFHTFFIEPLYNGLVFLMDILPWPDAGLAIIFLTLLVKLLLFPLSKKSIKTQIKMREIDPELKALREKYKNDKQKQAAATMALYKERGVNPFSGFLLILIQIPIIIALYQIFLKNGLPVIETGILYSFVPAPENVSISFLGLIDITKKSLFLALLAGVSQFFQTRFSIPAMKQQPKKSDATFQESLAWSMNVQMRYVFPLVAFFISWSISGAIALYWTTSNIFAIVQELVVRRKIILAESKSPQNQQAKHGK